MQQVKGKESLPELVDMNAMKGIMFSSNVSVSPAISLCLWCWYPKLMTLESSSDLPKVTHPSAGKTKSTNGYCYHNSVVYHILLV